MSDVTVTKDQVIQWFQRPAVVTAIHTAFASSGVIGAQLIKWKFPEAELGPLADLAIQIGPLAALCCWNLATRTYDTLTTKAAQIIASRRSSPAATAKVIAAIGSEAAQGVSINVDSTAPPEVQAVARGPLPGVNMVVDAAASVIKAAP